MFNSKRLVLAALAAAAIAAPAHASVVTLNFAGNLQQDAPYTQPNNNAFAAGQLAFYNALSRNNGGSDPGSAYNFTIQYDTTATAVSGKYAATLVSGSVGSFSNSYFSDFDTYITFTGGSIKYMNLWVAKQFGPGQFIYSVFNFGDNTDVVPGVLPAVVTPALYSNIGVSFEIWGGPGSRGYMDNTSRGLSVVPPGSGGPSVGGIPEPASWALMIIGFGSAGALIRSRRRQGLGVA